ncbi:hypothetical protein HAP94_05560 [Acidithiobacillus ferrivorans]|nr:hypothetical protein [Acidithiobacillus ferrivorans]
MDILQAVHTFFRADGYGQKHIDGYQYNEVQHDLAVAFAKAMPSGAKTREVKKDDGTNITLSSASLGILQSPTGTGKTLAYAVVGALLAAIGKRVVISTYTLALLRQVHNGKDMRAALDYAEKITGTRPKLAQKLGRGNYVSPSRAAKMRAWCASEKIELKASDKQFFQWAASGGLFMAYREEYGDEPPIIRSSDGDLISLRAETALRAGDPESDQALYDQDCEDSRDANLIVTTHHSILLHGKAPEFGFGAVDVVLSDEADRISDAAESLSERKFRPIDGERLASRLLHAIQQENSASINTGPFKAFLKESEGFRKTLDGCRAGKSVKTMNVPVGGDLLALYGYMQKVHKHGNAALKILQGTATGGKDIPHMRDGLEVWLKQLTQWKQWIGKSVDADIHIKQATLVDEVEPGDDAAVTWVRYLSWSPLREEGGMAQSATEPLKAYGWLLRKCIGTWVLTSATLAVKAKDSTFSSARGEFGFSAQDYGNQQPVKFPAPRNFGHLSLRTTPANIPNPFIPKSGGAYNREWVEHATGMIVAAAGQDKRVLVLTRSYNDHPELVPLLTQAFGMNAVVSQNKESGERLDAFLRRASRSHETRVILSPGAWEGVEVRTPDGKVWMTELVIPRLPIIPTNKIMDQQRAANMVNANADSIRRYMQRVKDGEKDLVIPKKIDWSAAETILHDANNTKSLRIFIQGVGRLIRGFDDRGTLWVGDPRFSADARQGQAFYDLLMRWRPETAMDQRGFRGMPDDDPTGPGGAPGDGEAEVPVVKSSVLSLILGESDRQSKASNGRLSNNKVKKPKGTS